MPRSTTVLKAKAAFPLNDAQVVVLLDEDLSVESARGLQAVCSTGRRVTGLTVDKQDGRRLTIKMASARTSGVTIDSIRIHGDALGKAGGKAIVVETPQFVHGVKDPTELKALQLLDQFPFASKLSRVHVSVACCTGCNGGIHDRNLVVLNHHMGGPWTGIWVQTAKTIEAPYPRWQKVLCAGGVISDLKGSVTVVDEGWMEIHKQFEVPHSAPPPLPVTCAQLPTAKSPLLIHKGLDASWVEFSNLMVESTERSEPPARRSRVERLTRNRITFSDHSGGSSTAFLYQPTGLKLSTGSKVSRLRGFVHAEGPGQYVLLSDKEEDIIL